MGSRSFGSVVGSARRMPATSRDYLFAITVGYLLVPNVVFLASWLTPLWGFPAAVLVLACLIDVWRRAKTSVPPLTARQWVFVAALALVSTAVSGIGELNVQVWDYLKHNLAFHDLVAYRWPVVYPYPNPGGSLLCYYIAYYLPASLAGKLLGLAWTAQASFVWGLVGVLLAFAWVARLGRPRGGVVLAVFMLVDGFAWLPGLYPFAQRLGLLAGTPGGDWWTADRFTERFASFGTPPMRLLFESEPTHLLWSPQHAIAAWLATACVLRTLEEGEPPRYLGLVFAATLLWSPLVVIGLAPFVLMSLLRDRGAWSRGPRWRVASPSQSRWGSTFWPTRVTNTSVFSPQGFQDPWTGFATSSSSSPRPGSSSLRWRWCDGDSAFPTSATGRSS